MSRATQLRLKLRPPRTHGGARRGAGRKPANERPGVSHHGRDDITAETPVHVTLRVLPHVWNLRSRRSLAVFESALEGVKGRADFRVVHFSLQGEHLHLLVEADDEVAIASGMQALTVRAAKALNRMMRRHGTVFADRYHAHVLHTSAEVRNALAYVLLNRNSHMVRIGARPDAGRRDDYSSAATLDGWADGGAVAPRTATSAPCTWLLRAGWKRRGLLSPDERPGT